MTKSYVYDALVLEVRDHLEMGFSRKGKRNGMLTGVVMSSCDGIWRAGSEKNLCVHVDWTKEKRSEERVKGQGLICKIARIAAFLELLYRHRLIS